MPASESFRCSQIMHLSTLSRNSDIATMSPMEYLCQNFDKIGGHISEIYTVLTNSSIKQVCMLKWEADLQENIELDEWHVIAQEASKSLINTSIIETNYKVLLRWCMVPARLATYVPTASPLCFRSCGQEGTMYHVWWQCPKVRRYSIRVYNFIYTLTQVNLVKSPKQALLGGRVERVSKPQRRLITFIFISAKIIIAKSWKTAALPFAQLKHKLSWIMLNERMTAILQDKMQMYKKVWDPWVEYLAGDPRSLPE